MLQRIQSVYLFIVTVLTALMTFMPLGEFRSGQERIELKMYGFVYKTTAPDNIAAEAPASVVTDELASTAETISSAWGLLITIIAATVLPFVTIFLYKNRLLQLRLCIVEMILLCGIILFVAWYMRMGYLNLKDIRLDVIVQVSGILPLISLIFTWLALRGIKKDILLLKSMDRIR